MANRIYDLTATCTKCQMPSEPGNLCPLCMLKNFVTPPDLPFWEKTTRPTGSALYRLRGPIYGHLGKWENPGPHEGMWHAHVEGLHFFIAADKDDTEALSVVEGAVLDVIRLMHVNLGAIHKIGGILPIIDEE